MKLTKRVVQMATMKITNIVLKEELEREFERNAPPAAVAIAGRARWRKTR